MQAQAALRAQTYAKVNPKPAYKPVNANTHTTRNPTACTHLHHVCRHSTHLQASQGIMQLLPHQPHSLTHIQRHPPGMSAAGIAGPPATPTTILPMVLWLTSAAVVSPLLPPASASLLLPAPAAAAAAAFACVLSATSFPSCRMSRFTTAQYTTSHAKGFHAAGSCIPFLAALSFRKQARLRCNRSQAALKSEPLLLLLPPGSGGLLLLLPLELLGRLPAVASTPLEGLLP